MTLVHAKSTELRRSVSIRGRVGRWPLEMITSRGCRSVGSTTDAPIYEGNRPVDIAACTLTLNRDSHMLRRMDHTLAARNDHHEHVRIVVRSKEPVLRLVVTAVVQPEE